MRGWVGNSKMYRQPISMVFHSVLDWTRTNWTYAEGLIRLFHSFWGRYAWSHLFLPSAYLYPLGLVTIAAIIGCGIVLVGQVRGSRASESWQHRAWAVLGVACLMGWGGAILRVHPLFITFNYLWPMARYAAVAIVPTAALLCLGLAAIIPRRWLGGLAFAGLLGMVALDAIALLIVIVPFYYG
jgi:hypothetical protein